MATKARAKKNAEGERQDLVLKELARLYPDVDCALEHGTAYQLLVSTILSAQCTDERVNKVTPPLFKAYPTAEKMSKAPLTKIEALIRSTGFFRSKAKNIREASKKIIKEHDGEVPDEMEDLVALPGVGRKTANVVLGNWFQKQEGVVVDTHVKRLSNRLGLTKQKDPVKIEKDLIQIVPQKDWAMISHRLIWHGRGVCKAIKPRCPECTLAPLCPSAL